MEERQRASNAPGKGSNLGKNTYKESHSLGLPSRKNTTTQKYVYVRQPIGFLLESFRNTTFGYKNGLQESSRKFRVLKIILK